MMEYVAVVVGVVVVCAIDVAVLALWDALTWKPTIELEHVDQ